MPYELLLASSPGEIFEIIHDYNEERNRIERAKDFRNAALQACICNIHRKKGAKAFRASEFLTLTEDEQHAVDEAEFLTHFNTE